MSSHDVDVKTTVDTPQATVPENTANVSQPLSKNAQKRLAKAARTAELKKERRAAEKERKKEKKRVQAEKRAAGELEGKDDEQALSRKKRRMGEGPRTPFGATVVVDLGFDSMMTDNEVKSLTSQLAYTYSANRKAERPFAHLLFTSLNGRTLTRLESLNNAAYKRWVDAEWWEDGYEKLWEGAKEGKHEDETVPPMDNTDAPDNVGDAERQEERKGNGKRRRKQPVSAPRESVVYLTADSSEELTELKEDETYIIGGICDHNRYKNLCLNKSRDTHIRSARLPIGTYLAELKTRKVLTVNQTFEILLKWVETRDWEQALWAVIPKRKFHEARKRGKGGTDKSGDASEGDDDGAEGEEEVKEITIDAHALEEAGEQGEADEAKAAVEARMNEGTTQEEQEADQ
ncbi:uncharacterized protein LAESUDRAFT_653560 [Laetiporus sulphureus 93-53]|uniref:tRNA (guanine(9)-N1)-methyltransferase n=1 Tax=Laetiporus sulphureus 93-53 TaxID=1314785 RepID=A0A165E9A3_9APHY|nr:uncharacterized protein LAESUDRAFT_653560 [Laetiporus sulphureus 93-53]KZT06515.1 hypothetical protein LAESUDRAFT_653560 [Laetiporus sulphureus 93-53]